MGGSWVRQLLCLEKKPVEASQGVVPTGFILLDLGRSIHYSQSKKAVPYKQWVPTVVFSLICLFIKHLIQYLSTLCTVIIEFEHL